MARRQYALLGLDIGDSFTVASVYGRGEAEVVASVGGM
jgi:hypothetical protein